ncbi:hypothetical protein PybrP1_006516 [[Pythium] brassicae (nom. inval.)]|nr:hypothetical protein PybrP1_006516 [[Pythium] brassicae (nom. inval.)]
MHIEVTNLREGDALPHPLVLLEGVATALSPAGDPLVLEARVDAARRCAWPVAARTGRFKALVLLPAPGVYVLTLQLRNSGASDGHVVYCERAFTVAYAPPPTSRVVRFYYQSSSDGAGFDAPPGVDTSDDAAVARIRLNALLMQTATAEMLHVAGLPRRTFAMELAADGLPRVRVLRSSFSNATARAVSDQELIRLVHGDIDAQGLDAHAELEFKHAVILGCSSYNPVTQRAEGHTALGGDKVGVFGSCGLHTWPRHLGEVTAAWLDNRKVDPRVLMDDSCYRGTHWANYATGLGAFLHELGHTFGLGHAASGIMGRGFDDMNRLFSVYEIDPHGGQPGFHAPHAGDGHVRVNLAAVREVEGPAGAHWNSSSARLLQHCPWISGVSRPSKRVPSVSWVHDVCGPVGQGEYDGQQIPFESGAARGGDAQDLGAVRVDFGSFLNRIQTFTRAEVASWDASKWRASGGTHLFVLAVGEYVTHVDVRAMAFIDGVQIHTNRRSSRWFGGFGGAMEVLKPAHGCKIHGFFGTLGDSFVGTLGARCSPIGPADLRGVPTMYAAYGHTRPAFVPFRSPTLAGLALSDGAQYEFTTPPSPTPFLHAIAVTCDSFVESVRVLSRDDHAAAVREQDARTFEPHEHVFELMAGERLVRVEARSGHWVDCVRFSTNIRVSPWFGGAGGTDTTVLEAPAGYHVCGLFGTRGDNYVGSLGALFCEDHAPVPLADQYTSSLSIEQQTHHAPPERFSVMYAPAVPPPSLSDAGASASSSGGPALGILVATLRNCVAYVQSFDSAQAYDELLTRMYSTSHFDLVMCFPLTRAEPLVQVDVSFRHVPVSAAPDGPSIAVVDGVCFHTSTRCSSWLGAFNGDALRFFMAPEGSAVCGLASVFTNATLTDIVGWHSPDASVALPAFVPDGRVRVESFRGFDVRLEARSEFGLESAHLLKKNGGDHLNCHAWDWTQFHPTAPAPRRWFLPQRMLLDKIPPERDDERGDGDRDGGGARPATASELLFSEYIVGALDCGGGFGKAAGPPSRF